MYHAIPRIKPKAVEAHHAALPLCSTCGFPRSNLKVLKSHIFLCVHILEVPRNLQKNLILPWAKKKIKEGYVFYPSIYSDGSNVTKNQHANKDEYQFNHEASGCYQRHSFHIHLTFYYVNMKIHPIMRLISNTCTLL